MSTLLKVATWNVNSIRTRLAAVVSWLEQNQPDVLCLQETKVENALFPHDAFAALGYTAAIHGQKSYNGVAILSRLPMADVTPGLNGIDLFDQARLLTATIAGVRIISAYVTNGEAVGSPKFAMKEEFYARLTAHMRAEVAAHPQLVLCGDFNVAADDRDVPNPASAAKYVLFTPTEREWLTTLCQQTGLADAFRLTSQEAGVYSWWDYRTYGRNPNSGMRIDYLFVTPALVPHVTTVTHAADERAKTQPSDHIPVTLTLSL